jgi:hypothetical protein
MSERMVGAFRVRVARSAGEELLPAVDVVRRAGQGGVGLMWTIGAPTSAVTSATAPSIFMRALSGFAGQSTELVASRDQPLVTARVVVVCAAVAGFAWQARRAARLIEPDR